MMTRTSLLAGLLILGCGTGDRPADGAGPLTVFDSTADTTVALTVGDPAPSSVRHLVVDLRIAPAEDDTSLFTEVRDFEIDRAGRLWVFDQPTASILLFAPDGTLLRRIGRVGSGPGEFRSNNGMVPLADTGIALWDSRNARITFLDRHGDAQTSWLTPAGFSTPDGLHRDEAGRLYLRRPVTPPREGEILGRLGLVRLRPDGSLGDSLVAPDLAVSRDVYVATTKDGMSSTGARHAARYSWAWSPEGFMIAGDGGRYHIVVERPGRRPLRIERRIDPIEVPDEERTQEQASIVWNLRQTDPGWTWHGPDLPRTKAPLTGLSVTRDGRIWASIAGPSERVPDEELTPPRDPTRPVVRYRSLPRYEVFSPDGRFLGRVECGCRMTLVDAEGDTVWAIVRDDLDLPAVTRFRIEPALGNR